MTICLAAFAEDCNAIVCVADKAVSYGEYLQWDSDNTKIASLGAKGTTVLFSGSEDATAEILSRLVARADEIGDDVRETEKILEHEWNEAQDKLIEKNILMPRLLTRAEYITALTASRINLHIRSIAQEIEHWKMDCSFIVCGVSLKNSPFILSLSSPGLCTNMYTNGFHAVGSGWEKAVSRLLFSDHKRSDHIDRVIYDVFDAKANAEMAVGVGYEWDCRVLYRGRTVFDMTKEPRDLIERVWAKYNRSPFEKRTKEDLAPPPRNWKQMLGSLRDELISKSNAPAKSLQFVWPNARSHHAAITR